jgi:hypothetical protein
MRYEILNDDGEVINTIIATAEFVEANYPGKYREVSEAPAPEENDEWIITVAALYRRFDWCCDTPKQFAMAASTNPMIQGFMRVADARLPEGISLKSPSFIKGLANIAESGEITEQEAARISGTPPKPEERFKKG